MKTNIVTEKAGIKFKLPIVDILNKTPLAVSEVAARTCYQSFDKSEYNEIKEVGLKIQMKEDIGDEGFIDPVCLSRIQNSEILNSLSWVHHHESILEHVNVTFMALGVSRGVLQEHARHRIQSISVQSTRYTMSYILYAFILNKIRWGNISEPTAMGCFNTLLEEKGMFIYNDRKLIEIETDAIYRKLDWQFETIGIDAFLELSLSKDNIKLFDNIRDNTVFNVRKAMELLKGNKQKRNVGDNFKHIVTDNWLCDMVFTMNLRALKNYLNLRDSGAAFFQIRNLAIIMEEALPEPYLNLVKKEK